MPSHEYTASDALETVIRRVDKVLPELAARILQIINEGTVATVADQPSGRKKKRFFRQSQPFSDEEALQVALDALRAYFVELPACIESAETEFAKVTRATQIGSSRKEVTKLRIEDATTIAIELVPETAKIGSPTRDLVELVPPGTEQLEQERQNVIALQELLDFS